MGYNRKLVNKLLLFLETGQYFGTSQNRIEDKQTGTKRVLTYQVIEVIKK